MDVTPLLRAGYLGKLTALRPLRHIAGLLSEPQTRIPQFHDALSHFTGFDFQVYPFPFL